MRISLMGKRWDLIFKKIPDREGMDGYCEPPDRKRKRLVVDSRLEGEKRLEIVIHETTHGSFDFLDESYVARFAEDLARVLTKLGYTDN